MIYLDNIFVIGNHPKEVFNGPGFSNVLTTKFGFPNQHLKICSAPRIDFGIFRSASEFSRHYIESPKIETFESSETMQGGT